MDFCANATSLDILKSLSVFLIFNIDGETRHK